MDAILSIMLFGASAAIAALLLDRRLATRKMLEAGSLSSPSSGLPLFLRPLRGLALRLQGISARLVTKGWRWRVEKRVVQAGKEGSVSAEEFCALQFAAALVGAFAAILLLGGAIPFRALLGAGLGWWLPAAWLVRRAVRRRQAVERELPGAFDWLTLSVEAGEGFAQALGRIATKLKEGPLREELMRLDADLRVGVRRKDALLGLARRVDLPALSSAVALLVQAEGVGTSVGPLLRSLSRRLREERLARAERRGVAAQQKALFPLVLCIMPATFVVIFGPLAVRLMLGGL